MRAALEILSIILRALERLVTASRQNKKQEKIDEAYEDPEQFFDTHFSGHGDRLHELDESDPEHSSKANDSNSSKQ
jgi:hypothetical protein